MANKLRMSVWLDEKIAKEIERILENENFKSRSEFIEKASEFYIEYISFILVNIINVRVSLTKDRT